MRSLSALLAAVLLSACAGMPIRPITDSASRTYTMSPAELAVATAGALHGHNIPVRRIDPGSGEIGTLSFTVSSPWEGEDIARRVRCGDLLPAEGNALVTMEIRTLARSHNGRITLRMRAWGRTNAVEPVVRRTPAAAYGGCVLTDAFMNRLLDEIGRSTGPAALK